MWKKLYDCQNHTRDEKTCRSVRNRHIGETAGIHATKLTS